MRTLFFTLLYLTLSTQLAAFPRKVMLHEFTAEWCIPCGDSAPVFSDFLEPYLENDQVTVLITHISPDPWYDRDPASCLALAEYYQVEGIPDVRIDGAGSYHPGNPSEYQSVLTNRLAQPSPLSIELHTSSTLEAVQVAATVRTAEEAVSGNVRLRFAIQSLFWDQFTGENDQDEWHHDMLVMSPDITGIELNLEPGSSETVSVSFPWPQTLSDTELAWNNVKVIAWVQDVPSREILQSEWARVTPAPYDHRVQVASENHLVTPGEFTTGRFWLENVGSADDDYDVTIQAELPAGWSYEYDTPEGVQSGPATIGLASQGSWEGEVRLMTAGIPGQLGTLEFAFASQANPPDITTVRFQTASTPDILLLNDSPEATHGAFYQDALDALPPAEARSHLLWNTAEAWFPYQDLQQSTPDLLIWFGEAATPDPAHAEELRSLLTSGLSLLVSGRDLIDDLVSMPLAADLGLTSTIAYSNAAAAVSAADSPLGDDLLLELGGGDGADNLDEPVQLNPLSSARSALIYNHVPTRRACITRTGGGYRTALLGFPFEAVSMQEERNLLMERLVLFLLDDDVSLENSIVARPQTAILQPAAPNPFNPGTRLAFSLPTAGRARLGIFNLMGQEVISLHDGRLEAGSHTFILDARGLASGAYVSRLQTDSQVQEELILLVK